MSEVKVQMIEPQQTSGIRTINTIPKKVNHGNVFGTGDWLTFYCGNCGKQLEGKVSTCQDSSLRNKGCGASVEWE